MRSQGAPSIAFISAAVDDAVAAAVVVRAGVAVPVVLLLRELRSIASGAGLLFILVADLAHVCHHPLIFEVFGAQIVDGLLTPLTFMKRSRRQWLFTNGARPGLGLGLGLWL